MARKVRAASLETRTSRLKLPVRKKSYFVTVARGIAVGYRRNRGAGTWSVRAGSGPDAWLKAFAIADDFEEADGEHVLTFWQAQERARSLARATEGSTYRPATVGEALDHYEADLVARGGDVTNARRVRKHLPASLAAKAVSLLTARELRQWRDGLIARKGLERASADRTARMLKAALGLAAAIDHRVANAAAWRIGLARLPDGERARNVVLSEETVRILIAEAYTVGRVFGAFVETLAITGTRTSQALKVEARDLQDNGDGPRLMISTSRKGRNRRVERKPVPITPALAAMLREIVGRSDDAPLFDRLMRPGLMFTRMVARLGLDREITLYSLRHTNITRLLLANVPTRVVAALHDTSVTMLERTYSKYIADHSDALVRRVLLQPEPPLTANVVPLKG